MNKLKFFIRRRYIDIIIISSFIITYIILFLFLTKNGVYYFASSKDFDVQHYLLPEYLREVFKYNHELFPKFSFNLASGTNIYNLAYYGLFNPFVLLSFLFYNVRMLDFVIVIMSIIILLSTFLLYIYLRKNYYSYITSFICSFLFLCSGPLIFHSHRHIMFIDYFPFLLLGFFGTDLFINKKRSFLLIISIFLMILTSYFYSVSGICVLFLYGVYKYIKNNTNIKFIDLFKFTIGLVLRYIPSVFAAAFLLIPTAFALLNGRSSNDSLNLLEELFSIKNNLLYQSYNMGLTIISLISIIYFIFRGEKANRFLAIVLFVCSFISFPSFILDGFLYVEGKSLIPFIPLAIILVAEFLENNLLKTKLKYFIVLYLIISSFTVCVIINSGDKLIPKNSINHKNEDIYKDKVNKLINNNDIYRIKSDLLGKDYINRITNINEYKTTSYLSSNNSYYNSLYKYSFENPLAYRNSMMFASSNNLLFEINMGEKYIFSRSNYDNIYKKIDEYNDVNIYENEYVLPIGYATNRNINISDYKKLNYPDNIINTLGTIVSEEKTNIDIKKSMEIDSDYFVVDYNNLKYDKTTDGYIVKSKDNGFLKLKSNNDFTNKILVIQFEVDDKNDCLYNDLEININSLHNVLTCKNWKYYNDNNTFSYTLTDSLNELNISFIKGTYKIHNIKLYSIDYDDVLSSNDNIYPMIIDKAKSNQDTITGNISVLDDSYFTASIPYDKGLVVKVDNKVVEYDLTNESFIGFLLKKGNHIIEISYIPQGYYFGLIVSIIGLLSFIGIILYERRRYDENT